MLVPILILSPSAPLAEFLARTLVAEGDYRPIQAITIEEALHAAIEVKFSAALFDAELVQPSAIQSARLLRQLLPDIPILFIPDGENVDWSEISPPYRCLKAPLSMAALFTELHELLESGGAGPRSESIKEAAQEKLPWLDDVQRAAQHLIRLSLEVSAQAALITRASKIWAYAGQLPQEAAEELAQAVSRHIADKPASQRTSDFAQFIRLETTQDEYMLYATHLVADMALALVFEAQTPFSQIRAQANTLARALASPPVIDSANGVHLRSEKPLPPAAVGNSNQGITPVETLEEAVDDHRGSVSLINWGGKGSLSGSIERENLEAENDGTEDLEDESRQFEEMDEDELQEDSLPIPSLFFDEAFPPPFPPSFHVNSQIDPSLTTLLHSEASSIPGEWIRENEITTTGANAMGTKTSNSSSVDSSQPGINRGNSSPAGIVDLRGPLDEEETGDSLSALKRETAEEEGLTPMIEVPWNASPGLPFEFHLLSYAVVLIPRLPAHRLANDVVTSLTEWLKDLHLAFGWRLTAFSAQPDSLSWISHAPPDISPALLVRTIREHTSRRLFDEVPHFARENPSGDFWAPAYLLLSREELPAPQTITEFTNQVRRRQNPAD